MKAGTTAGRIKVGAIPPRRRPMAAARTQSRHQEIVNRILVPIDFSDCSRTALHYAVSLARLLNASLILLYVAETNPAGSALVPCHVSDLETDLRQMAKQKLAQLINQD